MRGLFTEFEQAEAAIRRRNGGTGLGLAISMQLARAMGGEIRVVERAGQGLDVHGESWCCKRVPLGADSATSKPPSSRDRARAPGLRSAARAARA